MEDVKEVVEMMSDNDNSSDGVGGMSGSDSDSEMSEEDKTVADTCLQISSLTPVMLLSLTQLF